MTIEPNEFVAAGKGVYEMKDVNEKLLPKLFSTLEQSVEGYNFLIQKNGRGETSYTMRYSVKKRRIEASEKTHLHVHQQSCINHSEFFTSS